MNLRSPEVFYGLVAFLLLWRLIELVLSRRNLAEVARTRGDAGERAGSERAWRAMVVLHALWFVAPAAEVLWRGRVAGPVLWWSAMGVLALASSLRVWVLVTLGSAWNARAVVHPELRIVTHGPYRRMRHPNYLAVVLEFLALPAAGAAWVSLIVLNALHVLVLRRRILDEERLLARIPGYTEAMANRGGILPR